MVKIRVWQCLWIAWFIVLYGLERMNWPVPIHSSVLVSAAVLGLAFISIRPVARIPLGWLPIISLIVTLTVKLFAGYTLRDIQLSGTLLNVSLLTIGLALSQRIALIFHRFESAVRELTLLQSNAKSMPFAVREAQFYREVQRARRFRRPLTLVTLGPDGEESSQRLNETIEEVQRKMGRRLVEAEILNSLQHSLPEGDVVAQRDGHFVVLLSEVDEQEASKTVRHLLQRISQSSGVRLRAGMASFPEQEVTLVGLLKRAEDELHAFQEAERVTENASPNSVEHLVGGLSS